MNGRGRYGGISGPVNGRGFHLLKNGDGSNDGGQFQTNGRHGHGFPPTINHHRSGFNGGRVNTRGGFGGRGMVHMQGNHGGSRPQQVMPYNNGRGYGQNTVPSHQPQPFNQSFRRDGSPNTFNHSRGRGRGIDIPKRNFLPPPPPSTCSRNGPTIPFQNTGPGRGINGRSRIPPPPPPPPMHAPFSLQTHNPSAGLYPPPPPRTVPSDGSIPLNAPSRAMSSNGNIPPNVRQDFSHDNRFNHPYRNPGIIGENQVHPYNAPLPDPSRQPPTALVYPATDPRRTVPPPPTSTITEVAQVDADKAWKIYIPPNGGRPYFYNTVSKISVYDKPLALVTADAIAHSNMSTKPIVPTSAPETAPYVQWKEYKDANSGKNYYCNGTETVWERPASLGESTSVSVVHVTSGPSTSDVNVGPPRKKKRVLADNKIEFSSREEALAAFGGLLLAKEIDPSQKWNDIAKLCAFDPRWIACEAVLTLGDRKQTLAEYQTKRANHLRALERQEKARSRESFMQMLTDTLPQLPGFSSRTSQFVDVREILAKQDRFHAVVSESTREVLFVDFCEECRKREERTKRNKKRDVKEAYEAFLSEKEESGVLSYSSTWSFFVNELSDSDKVDVRFVVSSEMTESNRQLYFADFVVNLQAAEDDKRSRIRVARQRAEKAQREDFHVGLQSLVKEGQLHPWSRWRDVENIVSSLSSYSAVLDQNRDAPRDVFEDFASDLNDVYRHDRSILRPLMHSVVTSSSTKQIIVTEHTTFEEFSTQLLSAARETPDFEQVKRIIATSDSVSSARLYWRELMMNCSGGSSRGSLSRQSSYGNAVHNNGEIVEDGEIEET